MVGLGLDGVMRNFLILKELPRLQIMWYCLVRFAKKLMKVDGEGEGLMEST